MGYFMAGFDVLGVDKEPQPRYPFRFFQLDVTRITKRRARRIRELFDGIAASPPCHAHSDLAYRTGGKYPDLVGWTRELLDWIGLPYVIENVEGAPLIDPITLCGSSFGLRVRRHRLFETNWDLRPLPCNHDWQELHRPYTRMRGGKEPDVTGLISVHGSTGGKGGIEAWKVAMGIDWMTGPELAQAIPPAYTYYIGRQLLKEVRRRADVA